jgi:hypothetical protein
MPVVAWQRKAALLRWKWESEQSRTAFPWLVERSLRLSRVTLLSLSDSLS